MKISNITENFNFVPIKLKMMFRDTELAIGTGFFYRFMNSTHLVTNWHNVTGRHPETNKALHSQGSIPNQMHVGFPCHETHENRPCIRWDWRSLRLYNDEEMQQPAWYEHPIAQHRIDVVTLPISELETTAVIPANDSSLDLAPLRLRPGLDVFILGFPRGMSGGGHFPIWKRGSIATEPDIDIDDLPKLFVDTATREGMSGAPVFAQEVGFWVPEEKAQLNDAMLGTGRRFLGIYSGRVGDDPFQAQLGIVWKPSSIEEIIKSSITQELQKRQNKRA